MGINVRGIKNPEKVFSDIEHKIRECFIKNGGSISHHHGVGKLRKDFMPETISPGSIDVIQGIKKSQDPNNIFGISNNIVNKNKVYLFGSNWKSMCYYWSLFRNRPIFSNKDFIKRCYSCDGCEEKL